MAEQELNRGQFIGLEALRLLGVREPTDYKFMTQLSYVCPNGHDVYRRILEVLMQASHGLGEVDLEGWRFDYEAVGQVVEGAFLAVQKTSQSTLYLVRWALSPDPGVSSNDIALPAVIFQGLEPLGEVKLTGHTKIDAWRKSGPTWSDKRLKSPLETEDFHQVRGSIHGGFVSMGIKPIPTPAKYGVQPKAYDRWQDFREFDQCSFWFSRYDQIKHLFDQLTDYDRPDTILDVIRVQINRYEQIMDGEQHRYRFWLGMAVREKPLEDVPKGNVALQIYDLIKNDTLFVMEGYF